MRVGNRFDASGRARNVPSLQKCDKRVTCPRDGHMNCDFGVNADLLLRCSALRDRLMQPNPTPTSRAELDISEFCDTGASREVAERIIICNDYWTVVTADQLRGLAVVIDSGRTGYSMFPIMRSIIEHSAWIAWILDNNCSGPERIVRANLAFLNTGAQRTQAAAYAYGKTHPIYVESRNEFRRLQRQLKDTFSEVDIDSVTIDRQSLPAPTEIIKHMGRAMGNERLWLGVYHYLCGMANHPSLSVVEIVTVGSSGNHFIEITDERMQQSVRSTIGPYLLSLHYMCAYMGWPNEALARMYDEVADN